MDLVAIITIIIFVIQILIMAAFYGVIKHFGNCPVCGRKIANSEEKCPYCNTKRKTWSVFDEEPSRL